MRVYLPPDANCQLSASRCIAIIRLQGDLNNLLQQFQRPLRERGSMTRKQTYSELPIGIAFRWDIC